MNIKKLKKITGFISILLFFSCNSLLAQDSATGSQPKEAQAYYKIGVNDLLGIFVKDEAALTQDMVVMPDGRIIFPMIGEIMAEGHSAIELKDSITEKLTEFIKNPVVTVMVRQSNSRRIYTIGNVGRPGPYPLESKMTVLQALSVAGGFTEWADRKFVMVVRRLDNKETMYRFNYQDFIAGKDLSQNILLEPGDTIVVP
ncbi:MAG: polysaccharide biosynthesis/export family protein [Deltaproteobacteria bacterium]|nr:polysaccharide biosynthesis/export family protein [Deltaproteobacteria bacterium]